MFDYQAVTHAFENFPDWLDNGSQSLRRNLLDGIQDHRCGVCWQQEKAGSPSHRQRHNYLFQSTVQEILSSSDTNKILPFKMLHLDFDNLCNLKCIMCSPALSSSLQTEILSNKKQWAPFQEYQERPIHPWHKSPMFDRLLVMMDTVEEIFITGGEPLMNPGALRLLEQVDLTNKILSVTTNGTQMSKRILDLLSQAGGLSLHVSLEGIGAHNNYIRAGSDWHQLVKNIHSFNQLPNYKYDGGVGINHTLQVTSAWTLPPLINWCLDNHFKLTINPLTNPKHLHISAMYDSDRDKLIKELTELSEKAEKQQPIMVPWINGAINTLLNVRHDSDMSKKFYQYVAMLDSVRGTDFRAVFCT